MSPNDHNLYWIRKFTHRMQMKTPYSPSWYECNRLRANQIREWRTRNTLKRGK